MKAVAPSALEILTAGAEQIEALQSLYKHLHSDDPVIDTHEAKDILVRLASYPGSAVFIGLDDSVIATSCTLIVIPNLTRGGAPFGLIENVVTDPTFRERGYGKSILQHAVAVAWDCGCYKVMLMTGSKNPATIRFYGDAGFRQDKTGFQIRRTLQD